MHSSVFRGVVALSSMLGARAATYNTSAYNDPTTGIDFQRWCDEDTGFCFGMALPESVGSDFVGQLIVPHSNSQAWGGVSLSGGMTNALLIAAWPSGDAVVSTLRETASYTNPAVFAGSASINEIADGTSINATHLTYTFLCSGCIVGAPATFDASDDSYFFGWALSDTAPKSPASSSSVLTYHSAGFRSFEVLLSEANSAEYSSWAAMADFGSTATPSPLVSSSTSTPVPSQTPLPSATPTPSNETYDYIVVGGGAAGIIAAERLAETRKKVLLIERGAAPIVSMGADDYSRSWNETLTPYDVPAVGSSLSQLGLVGDYLCPDTAGMAGCVLGGGAIVNALAFIYPQAADFDDQWPAGWKWKDVESAANRLYQRNSGSVLPSADGIRHPSWSISDGVRAGPTKVRRVLRRGGRATGVEVENASGRIELIKLRPWGKVILAAGLMSTPRILFNSGIGPDAQINTVEGGRTGVTLPPQNEWIHLPVGESLKDHPMFTITVTTNNNFTGLNASSVLAATGPDAFSRRLYSEGSGILTQGGHRLQFWTSNVGRDGVTRFYQGSCSPSGNGGITMKLYLTHGATSSGVLGINAAGSTVLEVDPLLQTDADREATTQFLQGLLDDMEGSSSSTGCSVQGYNSAAEIIAEMTSGNHYVGTTKMGADDGRQNGTSVVDTNMKVYGTENLYIVDASIHPDLPTGNTQAMVMIVAEAAAARIIALNDSSSSEFSGGSRGCGGRTHPRHFSY